jgi:phospholipid/cholesterol/gamma-HCH transport system substrate-binding protein
MKWSNEARIGLAVVTAAVILFVGIVVLRGIDLRAKQYSLRVFYPNVNGLTTGDVVTVAGLAIGRVESMSLTGRRIGVDLSIQTNVRLPRDSRATLKSETIMGGKFIAISPGADTLMLANGDSLSGDYEADLSELTATLSPISTNVLGILENVNSTFDEPTRLHLQAIVADLAHSSARLDGVISSGGDHADQALADFALFSRDLARFARTLDTLGMNQRGNIDTGITSFRRTSSNLERVSRKLETIAGDLGDVLARVRNGEGTLGKLVHEERLYNDLDSLSCNLNRLVSDIRENPQRYIRVSLF